MSKFRDENSSILRKFFAIYFPNTHTVPFFSIMDKVPNETIFQEKNTQAKQSVYTTCKNNITTFSSFLLGRALCQFSSSTLGKSTYLW